LRIPRGRRGRRFDFATQYFLRHLAQARSGEQGSRGSLAYTKALAEAIVLLVLMPSIALFCVIAWIDARVEHLLGQEPPGSAPLLVALVASCALVLFGHLWLSHRLGHFRDDHSAASHYDTAHDRRIVFWQKLIVSGVCGGVVPLTLLWLIAHF
jgi:hypothetical protein